MIPSLFALFALAMPPQLPPADLSGIYTLSSRHGENVRSGSVVVCRAGDTYVVLSSSVSDDGEGSITVFQAKGVGTLEGGSFVVAWQSSGGQTVVTRYAVKGETLSGTYATFPGDGAIHAETLTRKAKLSKGG